MRLDQFTGQDSIKSDLFVHIGHSIINDVPLEHSMFYGPPGLGKTTLANAIANEMSTRIIQKTGQEVTKPILMDILKELRRRDIFFIDEIHAVPTKTMEILYGPLQMINDLNIEKNTFNPFSFEGLIINPFTLIGATTAAGDVSKPLRDRIILSYQFKHYRKEELAELLVNKNCPKEAARIISQRSRGTPRIALNYYVRLRNQAITEERITEEICDSMFNRLGIDKEGYTITDMDILLHLYENGATSESELYKTLGIDYTDYRYMYEPFLLNLKVIRITSKGRALTKKGEKYVEASK